MSTLAARLRPIAVAASTTTMPVSSRQSRASVQECRSAHRQDVQGPGIGGELTADFEVFNVFDWVNRNYSTWGAGSGPNPTREENSTDQACAGEGAVLPPPFLPAGRDGVKPELHRFGHSRQPVVTVDGITGDPAGVIALAARLAPFPLSSTYYPGLRRVLSEDDADAFSYACGLLEAAAPFIGGAFDADSFDLLEASFSIVTTPPQALTLRSARRISTRPTPAMSRCFTISPKRPAAAPASTASARRASN
ncbi:hypothetical protein DdX_19877 [Ditylenchus destructor]|uniref:Uncharacterized protein n=1 Tax=Ditylenchus destructor TaxID=166010 RepID=A0AAD4MME3_9BILA|nr:hypothetical protein DdX_19877 [Ditylenchus destructor]